MSGSPTASSSVTMQQVRVSAPAPPAASGSASVRSPSREAPSSCVASSGFAKGSRRSALSATGFTSRATKSRTVSRISSCSGLRCRLNMRLFAFDAQGLDYPRPLVQLGPDVAGEVVRVAIRGDDLLLGVDLLDHRVLEEGGGFAAGARDD